MNELEERDESATAQAGIERQRVDAKQDRSLRAVVRSGTGWSLAGYGGSQVLRFGGNLILTRLLLPEAFGLMAIVNALLMGLHLFSDVGIGPSIIQSPRGDDRSFLNTAWTLQVLRGVVLSIVAWAVAGPVAAFYDEPTLASILPIAGLTALIAGFNSTRIFSMYRHVDLARISSVELGSQAVGIVVMVVLARTGLGIWALVIGGLAGSFSKLVLSHTILPGIVNGFRWDRESLAPMLRFGRWIFFSTLLTFLVGQSDRLIFGALLPLAMLGVYSIASMIAAMPATALSRMASGVFFPVYSRVHNSGRELAPVFQRVRRPVLIAAGWMIAGLAAGGDVAVRLLYDARYEQGGWILQLLALGSWFAVLEATNSAALLARGQANWTAASSAGKLLGMVALIPLGYRLGGFPGAVAGLAASDVLKYAVSGFAAMRAGLRGWLQDLRLTTWVFASAWIAWLLVGLAQQHAYSRISLAVLVFVVVTLAWAPLGLSLWRARSTEPSLEF